MESRQKQLRNRLLALAVGQSGYFTAAQAKAIGYSYSQQAFHRDHGNWVQVERALYRLPHLPLGLHDDLVRAWLWTRGKGVVSHESAARVHDLGEIDPLRTHLTVPPSFRATHQGVVLHRGILDPADTESRDGFRVTTPARTLVDVSFSGTDGDQLERAVADALDRHQVTRRQLRSVADRSDPRAALQLERALSHLAERRG